MGTTEMMVPVDYGEFSVKQTTRNDNCKSISSHPKSQYHISVDEIHPLGKATDGTVDFSPTLDLLQKKLRHLCKATALRD